MKARGGEHPLLAEVPLPPEVAHIWAWFSELARRQPASGFGPSPITWPEIDAWARLTRRAPSPFEIDCISAIDDLRLEFQNEWASWANGKPRKKHRKLH